MAVATGSRAVTLTKNFRLFLVTGEDITPARP